jgi:hypothetical protein
VSVRTLSYASRVPMSNCPPHVDELTMTVLLKNLFTVHFQFDLFKLETNNTRDDELKHAWITVR